MGHADPVAHVHDKQAVGRDRLLHLHTSHHTPHTPRGWLASVVCSRKAAMVALRSNGPRGKYASNMCLAMACTRATGGITYHI